jgi:hypothetical protein
MDVEQENGNHLDLTKTKEGKAINDENKNVATFVVKWNNKSLKIEEVQEKILNFVQREAEKRSRNSRVIPTYSFCQWCPLAHVVNRHRTFEKFLQTEEPRRSQKLYYFSFSPKFDLKKKNISRVFGELDVIAAEEMSDNPCQLMKQEEDLQPLTREEFNRNKEEILDRMHKELCIVSYALYDLYSSHFTNHKL